MTVFVEMYHPALDNIAVDVPTQAVDDYAARGWLLVDPDVMPVVVYPYLTQAAGDSRYVRDLELDAQAAALAADSASALAVAQRAAFVPRWKATTAVLASDLAVAPDGKIIQRNADGTTRSTYDSTEQGLWTAVIPDSSSTVKGLVELATNSETTTGTDTARAVTPAGLKVVKDTLITVVTYAGDLNAARPAGAAAVYWAGFPSTPTNATSADIVPVDASAGVVDMGIRTFDFIPSTGGATMGSANRIAYHRVRTGGTITKIGLHVVVQSGNVGVSVHSNTGSGAAALPGALVRSSGSVACPAVGYAEVSLGGSAVVQPGDWLSLWTDNTTASFVAVGSAQDATNKWAGQHAFQNSATPNPNPAVPSIGLIRGYILNGVA